MAVEEVMCWQRDWLISWEQGSLALRSFLHLGALIKQVCFIPCCPHLPTTSSSPSMLRSFPCLGDISRTVGPFRSNPRALDSPRRDLSNDTMVYGFSRHRWLPMPPTLFLQCLDDISGTAKRCYGIIGAWRSPQKPL